jgi:HEAT repeat protein
MNIISTRIVRTSCISILLVIFIVSNYGLCSTDLDRKKLMESTVTIPRPWLDAPEAIELVSKQTGLRYVVTARNLKGLTGPFYTDEKVKVKKLIEMVARASGMEILTVDGVTILQPELSSDMQTEFHKAIKDVRCENTEQRRRGAFILGESCRVDAIPLLVELLGDKEDKVRRTALLSLASFEGDFDYNQWEGRLSIFELPSVKLDTDNLLWVIEESAPAGGYEWKSAVSLLARARESQLSRAIWMEAWNKTPGTIMTVIRAVGRCETPDVKAMLEKRLRETFTNNPADRFEAGESLGYLGMVDILREHLLGGTKTRYTPLIRMASAYGLGFCKNSSRAVEALKTALTDSDPRVREMAVFALGKINNEESRNVLVNLLLDENTPVDVRVAGILFAPYTSQEVTNAIFKLCSDSNPRIRAGVAEALGQIGGFRSISLLAQMVRCDNDRWVRAESARSLAIIFSHVNSPELHKSGSSGTDFETRVAEVRGKISTTAIYDLFKELIAPKADPEVKLAAVIGMGQSRSPEWSELLSKVALDPDENYRIRKYAARSLAMLANRAGQATLLKLIEAQPPVRMTDVPLRYLDLGDADKTVKYLIPWVTKGTLDEQVMAAERLGEIGTPEAVKVLAGAFNAFENHSRFTQAWSLMRITNREGIKTLAELLSSSKRSGIRMNAALALKGRLDPAVIDALIKATSDPDPSVRKASANSLGECGEPVAAPALITLMEKDPDITVSHEALRALRRREYAWLKEVQEAFKRVRGTVRDCGIPGGPSVAEQPDNSWVLRRWAHDINDDTIVNLTYESAVVYDPCKQRIIQWGAHGRYADSPQTGMTWFFDVNTMTWTRPAPGQEPPGICLTRGLTMDPVRGLMISPSGVGGGHGWVMALRRGLCYSVPWLFDTKSEQWMPAHTLFHPGNATEATACFDLYNDVMLLNSNPLIYDPHVNQWILQEPPAVQPKRTSNEPGAYDPVSKRFIMLAGADIRNRARIWAYETRNNQWIELFPQNPPPPSRCPMVYDSANDVMLLFRREENRISTWVFHIRENRWEEMPPVYPSPSYGQYDVAYDPVHNVAVMSGGWEWGQSTAVTVRETWTYRYRKPEKEKKSTAPQNLKLVLSSNNDGMVNVKLSWEAPEAGAPGGYYVWRGNGECPWTAKFERITSEPVKILEFSEKLKPDRQNLYYYRVTALQADGKEGLPSPLVRTQPEVVREVFCARDSDGVIHIAWTPSCSSGIMGYNVYRARCEQKDFWRQTFDPEKNEKQGNKFVKLNEKPVNTLSFIDGIGTNEILVTSETSWQPLYVYMIKAVNLLEQESGPSPVTISVPPPPLQVMAFHMRDGRFMIISGSSGPLETLERGRFVYRMDSYKTDWAFRIKGAPHLCRVQLDDSGVLTGDRLCYFVIAVDGSGQSGIPGTEAWGLNPP